MILPGPSSWVTLVEIWKAPVLPFSKLAIQVTALLMQITPSILLAPSLFLLSRAQFLCPFGLLLRALCRAVFD